MLHLGDADAPELADEANPASTSSIEDELVESSEPDQETWPEEEPHTGGLRRHLFTFLATAVILGWTAFYIYVHLAEIRQGVSAALWSAWLADWSIPVLLVIVIWQLAVRSGRAEQARFADAATMLKREAEGLESRLAGVNRELSLARDFIASQSRDLESLGRLATERLSGNAERLQALIAQNGEQVDTIGQVGESALANMERLRDQLPVIANSTRDMANQIGNAGNVAMEQINQLVGGFERLEQFGAAGEKHVESISVRMMETLELFDRQATELNSNATEQFLALQQQSQDFRNMLLSHDEGAIEAIRKRADDLSTFLDRRSEHLNQIEEAACNGMRQRVATMISESDRLLTDMVERRNEASAELAATVEALETRLVEAIQKVSQIDEAAMGNARNRLHALAEEANRIDATIAQRAKTFEAEVEQRRENAVRAEAAALAQLEEHIASFDQQFAQRAQSHLSHMQQLAEQGEGIAARLATFDADLAQLGTQAAEAHASVGTSASHLAERLEASRHLLDESRVALAALSTGGSQLLELLRASSDQASGVLGEAVGLAETRLQAIAGQASSLCELVDTAEQRGASLAEHIEHAREHGANTMGLLEQLEVQLGEVAQKSASVASETKAELVDAIALLTASNGNALQSLREDQAEAVREIAQQVAEQSNSAIATALREQSAQTIAEIEASARAATEAGREAALQLRDQLAKVNELAGNLEQRVAHARSRAEENVGDDFARRMALITEALNSSAIDISKAFDNDVSDTQWTNYLRGDRGIFTRRAVRLLDKQDARSVLDLYEADHEFRETVNRYIHDFEAMLRQVLSTRDGNVMAVTLLSSDSGKLYVSLAQAIDRLRD